MRLGIAAVAFALFPLPALATPIAMEPEAVTLEWDGTPRGGQIEWSLAGGETDGTSTQLLFQYDIQVYQAEPSGILAFDVPVVSVTSSTTQMFAFGSLPDPQSLTWAWASICCVSSGLTLEFVGTLAVELAGVPTGVRFSALADGAGASLAAVPEPAAALAFGIGLLVVSRRLGRRGLAGR